MISDFEIITKALEDVGAAQAEHAKEMGKLIEKADTERAELGKTTEETGKAIAKLNDQMESLTTQMADAHKALKEKGDLLEAAQKSLDAMEAAGKRPGPWGGSQSTKSLGETFVESDAYKEWNGNRGSKESDRVPFSMKQHSHAVMRSLTKAAVTTTTPAAGAGWDLPLDAGRIWPSRRPMRIRNLMDVRPTDQSSIRYMRVTGFAPDGSPSGTMTHGAAAPVAETNPAPEAQLEAVEENANVQAISHFIPMSREALRDHADLALQLNAEMIYGVEFAEEGQILLGSGASPNLPGILLDPDIQSYAWNDGELKDSMMDALRRATNKAHVRHYQPTGVVIHPDNKTSIDLAKGDDGHYLWLRVAGEGIFRLDFVETTAIPAGTALIGDWQMGATLYDREDAALRISEHHADFFRRRMLGILAEVSVGLALRVPASFVAVDFTTGPPVAP